MSQASILEEIKEVESILSIATFPGLKGVISTYLTKLNGQLKSIQEKEKAAAIKETTPAVTASSSSITVSSSSTSLTYIPIEDFAWDQGEYNSPIVSIFIDLDDVGSVKDNVKVNFTKESFDVSVTGLNGKNYRLVKDNLEKDIIPSQSKFIVKKNKIVLKLQKVKGEYSYEHWTSLTAKKKRDAESADTKKDPMGGIMDMMKNMYEDGDENMKKIIGEAMLKSQRGEKMDPSSMGKGMGGLGDDF
eukprot:gene3987-5711_t